MKCTTLLIVSALLLTASVCRAENQTETKAKPSSENEGSCVP